MKKVSRYGYRFAGVSLDPKSECVPDQSLSVQEILRRFTTGTLSQGEIDRGAPYGDDICPDEDDENMRMEYDPDVDLVDMYEEAQRVDELKSRLKAQRSSKKKSSTSSMDDDQTAAARKTPDKEPVQNE